MTLASEDEEDRNRKATYKTSKGKPISWDLGTEQAP